MDETTLHVVIVATIALVAGFGAEGVRRVSDAHATHGATSLKRFAVTCPTSYLNGLAALTWVALAIFGLIYVVAILNADYWNLPVLVTYVVLGAALVLLNLYVTNPRVVVDQRKIVVRDAWGRERETSLGGLRRVEYDEDLIRAFDDAGPVLSIDVRFSCAINLLRRCEREGIPVEGRDLGPLTRRTLWRACARRGVLSGAASAGVVAVIVVVPSVANASVGSAVVGLVAAVVVGVLVALGLSRHAVWGLWLLSREERALGVSFDDEMARLDVRRLPHMGPDWFVDVTDGFVLAVRRDFVSYLSEVDEDSPKSNRTLDADCADGRFHTVHGSEGALEALRLWYEHKA